MEAFDYLPHGLVWPSTGVQDTVTRLGHSHELDGFRLSDRGRMHFDPRSVKRYIEGRRKKNFHPSRQSPVASRRRNEGKNGKRGR